MAAYLSPIKKRGFIMKRKFVPIWKAAEVAEAINPETGEYDWSFVSLEDMGFCKDGVTRWYWFDAADGTPCYTLKH